MRTICDNCKHCLLHPEGQLCSKTLDFVAKDDSCRHFDNDKVFDPTNLVLFTIASILIVILFSRIL